MPPRGLDGAHSAVGGFTREGGYHGHRERFPVELVLRESTGHRVLA